MENRTHAGIYLLLLILPFVFFHRVLPFVSEQTLGNDYTKYAIDHQMELLFSMKTGSFPLFVPGFAGGQSSSALTQGQIWHPISHIASGIPGYWGGKSLEWLTLLRLLSLGLTQIALFALLKRLSFENVAALLLSTLAVYNLRMLDLFRFGASLENWTGHILLCVAIGFSYVKPTKVLGPLSVVGATYWLVCGGHPQMMYYGLIGAGCFALVIPHFTSAVFSDKKTDIRAVIRFWGKTALCCFAGVVLSSAYILPFYFDFVRNNAGRIGQTYAWADWVIYRDTLIGTLCIFLNPLRSSVHGSFGGSSLFLSAALIPTLRLFRIKIPNVIWGIWGMALFGFLHMQGSRTPIHYLMWKYFPLASSFRIPGRISIIMPMLLTLLLAWVIQAAPERLRFGNRDVQIAPKAILSLVSLFFIGFYVLLPDSATTNELTHSPVTINAISHRTEWVCLTLGALTLAMFALFGYSGRIKSVFGIALCVAACLQIMLLLRSGTWFENKTDKPTFQQMSEYKREKLGYRGALGQGLGSKIVIEQVTRSCLEPSLGKIYSKYVFVDSVEAAYQRIEKGRPPDLAIIENHSTDTPVMDEPSRATNSVKLLHSSFNRLVFDAHAPKGGFFCLAYPFDGKWQASVNGRDSQLYRTNGAAQSVSLPNGSCTIEFTYSSKAAIWGMMLSCAGFAFIGCGFAFYARTKMIRMVIIVIVMSIAGGGFTAWHASLYTGDNLETRYSWQSGKDSPHTNLAYGRRTELGSVLFRENSPFFSSLAVDGNTGKGSGFVSMPMTNPWWQVDFSRKETVGSMVVYEGADALERNTRPLVFAISVDGKDWYKLCTVATRPEHEPSIKIVFDRAVEARFLRIIASGYGRLAIDEVEIYPPHMGDGG